MGGKFKRAVPSHSHPADRPRWLWPAAIGVAAVVLVGLVAWLLQSQQGTSSYTPEVAGQPSAAIDQTAFDYGDVKLNSTIKTVFRVRNVGAKELVFLGEPRVEVREGC